MATGDKFEVVVPKTSAMQRKKTKQDAVMLQPYMDPNTPGGRLIRALDYKGDIPAPQETVKNVFGFAALQKMGGNPITGESVATLIRKETKRTKSEPQSKQLVVSGIGDVLQKTADSDPLEPLPKSVSCFSTVELELED